MAGQSYPILQSVSLSKPQRRGLMALRRLSRPPAQMVRPREGHHVLVYRVDGEYVLDDASLDTRHDVVVRASHVTVVDTQRNAPIIVQLSIPARQSQSFAVKVTFGCTVKDPVTVVRQGLRDPQQLLTSYLLSYYNLMQMGLDFTIEQINEARRSVHDELTAYQTVSPPLIDGLEIVIASIEVLTPMRMAERHEEQLRQQDEHLLKMAKLLKDTQRELAVERSRNARLELERQNRLGGERPDLDHEHLTDEERQSPDHELGAGEHKHERQQAAAEQAALLARQRELNEFRREEITRHLEAAGANADSSLNTEHVDDEMTQEEGAAQLRGDRERRELEAGNPEDAKRETAETQRESVAAIISSLAHRGHLDMSNIDVEGLLRQIGGGDVKKVVEAAIAGTSSPQTGESGRVGDAADSALEQRLLQGRFPEHVQLGDRTSLLVRLGLRPGTRLEAGLRPLAVPEAGLEVILLLVENPGFTLLSSERQAVHVVPRQDSSWAGFELQSVRPGVHTLQIGAFAGGTCLGSLAIQVSVDPAARTGPPKQQSSPARVTRADPGQVSLILSYDPDQQVYRYRLVDSGGYFSEEAASDRLLKPPGMAIEQLVGQLNALARGQVTWDAATTKDWLRGQGIALWNGFIPQALQREFWQRQDRITQMTIISQGDPVPWELLYPFAPGGQDAGFLIDQFPVARRRHGPRPPNRLELRAADLVLSGSGSLAAAPAEIDAVDGLLRGRGLAARRIGDLPILLHALQHGDVGLLHFSCHNAFAYGTPNTSRILLGNQPFEPVFLEAHAGRFGDPLVFMNACRTDGQASLYTTVEGWASGFLRAGAGAFIGSLWEVVDTSASTYAQEFYRAALAGASLGESARRARDAIRDNPGDPTWLAYTFYGDPAATVRAQARQTD